MDILGLIDIPSWLLTIALICLAFYLYTIWTHSFFTKLGIKGPKPGFLGMIPVYSKKGVGPTDVELVKQYGKVYGTFNGRSPVLVIADLDMVRQICVKDFGTFRNRNRVIPIDNIFKDAVSVIEDDHWKFSRSVLTPTFSSGKMRDMLPLIQRCADNLVKNCEERGRDGKSLEMKSVFGAYTMDVVSSTLFGIDVDSQNNPDDLFIKYAKKGMSLSFFNPVMFICMLLPFTLPWFNKLGIGLFPTDCRNFFSQVAKDTLESRRKETGEQKRKDFLQLMLNSHKEIDSLNEGEDIEQNQTFQAWKKRGLLDNEIISNIVIFMLAGYDTTANTLSFASYCLATNPDIQEKAIEEIDSVVGQDLPTYDHLSQVKYLDMIVNETLRLYAPALRLDRATSKSIDINGYHIPEGTAINIPIFAVHRDPEQWPDPEKFDPERFTPENKAKRHPYSFMPFGIGPRNCIGMRLAMMEAKVALIRLLQTFRLEVAPDTQVPVELGKEFLLRPANDLYLRMNKRH